MNEISNETPVHTFSARITTEEVQSLQVAPEPEQLSWVEGFPAAGTRFSLVSTSNLWTDRKLEHNQVVRISGIGRVKGMATAEDKDGSLLYVYKVECNDAELA